MGKRIAAIAITLAALAGGIAPAVMATTSSAPVASAPGMHYYD